MNIFQLLKHSKEIQQKIHQLKERLQSEEVEVIVGGGTLKIRANLTYEIKEVKIQPEFLKDKVVMENLIAAAYTQLTQKIQERIKELYKEILPIPMEWFTNL